MTSLDPRGLGLFRILLACLLLLDLGQHAESSEQAFVAVGALATRLLVALFVLVYLGLALGYRTRAMQLGALIAHTSLVLACPPLRWGSDFALQLLLAFSALLPLGQRFSIDALSASWKARVEHVAAELAFASRPTRESAAVVTVAPLVALAAALFVPLQLASEAGVELGTSVWTAPLLVALAVAFLLLRPTALDALGRALARGRPQLICFFDSDCGICFQFARLLARLDVLERIELRSNQDHQALPAGVGPELVEHTIVAFGRGRARTYLRSEAIARLCLALPGGGLPFLVLRTPGLRALFERLYEQVARNRREISVALGFAACGVPAKPEPSAASAAAAGQARATTTARASLVLRELTLALLVLSVSWSALSSPPTHRSDSAAGREHAPDSARGRSR